MADLASETVSNTTKRDPPGEGGTIGGRLARYMGSRSQNSVEREAGAPSGYVSRLLRDERKHPDETIVRRICDVLQAPFEWVYYGIGADSGGDQGDRYPNRPVAIAMLRGLVAPEAVDAVLAIRLPESTDDLEVEEWATRLDRIDLLRREFGQRRRESDSAMRAVPLELEAGDRKTPVK